MPWKGQSVKDQRIEFVIRAKQEDSNISELCREFGITRPTGYLWLKRLEEVDHLNDLTSKSTRPHCSPNQIDPSIEAKIIELRKIYGWAGKKLKVILKSRGIDVSESTIDRTIKRNHLTESEYANSIPIKRFEHENPNDLWQMDFKGEFRMGEGYCYPFTVLDDCSRYSLSVTALTSTSLKGTQKALVGLFRKYGMPKSILTDHGAPWWSTTNRYGLTRLSVEIIKQGVELRFSPYKHPQTQGKIERFHRSLKRSIMREGLSNTISEYRSRFDRFRHDYNYFRPHEALEMDIPAQHYQPSLRPYQEHPKEWEYEEAQVMKLNTQGCMDYKSHRYFVSEALANERVSITEFGERALIKYRHMYVRELDLKKKLTYPIVRTSIKQV